MHSAPGGVQPDRPRDNYRSIVSDLVSLIEHMQASMKLLEGAIARELPPGGQEAGGNVIVLNDITPCYVKANAVLHACKVGLGVALDSLSGEPSDSPIVESGVSDRRVAALWRFRRSGTGLNKEHSSKAQPRSEGKPRSDATGKMPECRTTRRRGGWFVHKIFGDEQP